MIWREKRVLLTVLGVLLAANAIFFFTYRVQYEARLSALDGRMKEANARLQRARAKRIAAEQQLRGYDTVRRDLETLYDQRWATQAERFTALINEVKRLAAQSQLEPPGYSFSKAADRDAARFGGFGVTVVGINFTVHGNYQQIRRLINLLEISNQFVIIDGITLAGGGGSDLTLSLHLKTLFRDAARPPTPPQEM